MFCNRGIYDKGWAAVTRHSTPWVMEVELPPFQDDVWELYDTNTDWSQIHDLAAEMPDKLAELQQLWLEEARKYNVLPLDDRRIERFNRTSPDARSSSRATRSCSSAACGGLSENSVINLKNKSHSITAEIEVPESGAEGVIVAQGGAFGGWALYAKGGSQGTATTSSGCSGSRSRATRRSRRARTRCAWSSITTAAASERVRR